MTLLTFPTALPNQTMAAETHPSQYPQNKVANCREHNEESMHKQFCTVHRMRPVGSVVSLSSESSEKHTSDFKNTSSSTDRNDSPTGKKRKNADAKSKHLRRGKWTLEEEQYVASIIKSFNTGYLDAPAGTTLRAYLSDKLQCDPMRITKKFTGEACIGKRIFHPAVRCRENAHIIDEDQGKLKALEIRWRRRLDASSRESSRSSVTDRNGSVRNFPQSENIGSSSLHNNKSINFAATYAASWLDRAKDFLSVNPHQEFNRSQQVVPLTDVKHQMKAVRQLIEEAPMAGVIRNDISHPTNAQHLSYSLQQRLSPINIPPNTVEFDAGMFPHVGHFIPHDNNPRPAKKSRKVVSANHLSTIVHLQQTPVTPDFSSKGDNTQVEDAEILLDFMRSARQNYVST